MYALSLTYFKYMCDFCNLEFDQEKHCVLHERKLHPEAVAASYSHETGIYVLA
jgi:hypothetical protein